MAALLLLGIPMATMAIGLGIAMAMESRPKYRVLSFILGVSSLAVPMAIITLFILLSTPTTGVGYLFLALAITLAIECAILTLLFRLQ